MNFVQVVVARTTILRTKHKPDIPNVNVWI